MDDQCENDRPIAIQEWLELWKLQGEHPKIVERSLRMFKEAIEKIRKEEIDV